MTPSDMAYKLGTSWGIPAVRRQCRHRRDPGGAVRQHQGRRARGRLRATYTALRTYGVDADKASDLAVQRLQSTWGVSGAAGNQVMKNPPEKSYPQVDGTHDWMQKDLTDWVAKRAGAEFSAGPRIARWRPASPAWPGPQLAGRRHDRRRPDPGRDRAGQAAVLPGRDQAQGRHAGHPAGPRRLRSGRPHRQVRRQAARSASRRSSRAGRLTPGCPSHERDRRRPGSQFRPAHGAGRSARGSTAPTDGGEAIWGAAFRQTNTVVSALQYMRNRLLRAAAGLQPGDGHQGRGATRNTSSSTATSFVGSQSPAETLSIKGQIDQEEADRRTLAANGKIGFVAQMAGMLDPTMLLPGGVGIDAARGGLTFTKAAVTMGKAGLMGTARRRCCTPPRTPGPVRRAHKRRQRHRAERAARGGRNGAAGPAERAGLETALHADRTAINEHAGTHRPARRCRRRPAPAQPAPPSDTRKIELVDFGLNQIPGVRTVVEKTSPMQRVFGADSVTARRTGADLAETSLLTKENLEGGVTTAGPAVDREARLMIHQGQVAVGDELSKLFSEYRFGDQKSPRRARGHGSRTSPAARRASCPMTSSRRQVSDAMRNGDSTKPAGAAGPRSRSGRRFSSRGRSARSRPACCRRASTSRPPTAICSGSTTSRRSRRSGRSSSTG
jgi:hypothetical protein